MRGWVDEESSERNQLTNHTIRHVRLDPLGLLLPTSSLNRGGLVSSKRVQLLESVGAEEEKGKETRRVSFGSKNSFEVRIPSPDERLYALVF